MPSKFIQRVLDHPGSKGRLHRALGVPEGKPIPKAKLAAARKSKRKFEGKSVARMVAFADTLSKVRK